MSGLANALVASVIVDVLIDGDFHAIDTDAESGMTLRDHADLVAGPHGWTLVVR